MAEDNVEQTTENEKDIDWKARALKAEAKIINDKNADKEEKQADTDDKQEGKQEENVTFWKEDVEAMIKDALKAQVIDNQENQYVNNQNETNNASIGWEQERVTSNDWMLTISEYSKLSPEAQRNYVKTFTDKWEGVDFK